jgi:hypothetical protein
VRDAQGVIAPAEALIRDEQIGFVFIHLAVPHPPGVYDRRMQQVRGGSYLDNLALADVDLGSLLQAIASTRSAANTDDNDLLRSFVAYSYLAEFGRMD